MLTCELFDKMPDGRQIFAFTLKRGNISARVMNLGAILLALKTPDRAGHVTDIIGGFDTVDYYLDLSQTSYQGSTIGRFGNRIGGGGFTLDGKFYPMEDNNDGASLHGGFVGWNRRLWDVEATEDGCEPSVTFSLFSPDGESGYPGNVTAHVTYKLTKENGLRISYLATTDAPTVINMTNHSYFNLNGCAHGDVLDHELWLDADTYLPLGEAMIPTGEILPVAGTTLDFRTPKTLRANLDMEFPALKDAGGYDLCYRFVGGATKEPVLRGRLSSAKSGRVMEVYTDLPGVQVYSSNFLNQPFEMKNGFEERLRAFVCLETQGMPDAPNKPQFESCVLRPGEEYRTATEYRFSVN